MNGGGLVPSGGGWHERHTGEVRQREWMRWRGGDLVTSVVLGPSEACGLAPGAVPAGPCSGWVTVPQMDCERGQAVGGWCIGSWAAC